MEYQVSVTGSRRAAAAGGMSKKKKKNEPTRRVHNEFQFPAPLVLPGDSLALDDEDEEEEEEEPQSFEEWKNASVQDRNRITKKRNVIYLMPPPPPPPSRRGMKGDGLERLLPFEGEGVPRPDIDAIRRYLEAFYDGVKVKIYNPPGLGFVPWNNDDDEEEEDTGDNSSYLNSIEATSGYIGLEGNGSVTRIRTRRDPCNLFSCQLNVADLLDATIDMLPKDAYAMALVVHQDLYETEDDLFICGRAYGGSRVAVISTARYHTCLDQVQNVEREHAWPASHCHDYIMSHYISKPRGKGKKKKKKNASSSKKRNQLQDDDDENENEHEKTTHGQQQQQHHQHQHSKTSHPNPLAKAVAAHKTHFATPPKDLSPSLLLPGLWLSRLCRTTSHELGHCFGIEHCQSFACVMQASASIAEDARQPPYLCPECLAKVLHATTTTTASTEEEKEEKRYRALEICLDGLHRRFPCPLFEAFGEWLRARTTTELV